jgi:rubrerythrin
LFRAASEAEKTHARNHKQVLAKLEVTGLKAATYLKLPGATRENLADAIKGESYEIETMYPTMIQQAREEGQTDAERSMYYALSAEKQHVALFKDALKNLSRKPSLEAFYVCPICGATYTMHNVPAASPVCGTPKAQFKLVR